MVLTAWRRLLVMDRVAHRVSRAGRDIHLGPTEYRLLDHLMQHPGRVFSREQLLAAGGVPSDAGYERNVDSHIKSLRAKLRLIAATAEPIQTHRGLGYSYSPSHA